MEQIRVGIVGLGFVGKQHAEALRRIPGVKIAAASDSDPDLGAWCEANRIPAFYTDYRKMLEQEELDVIHDCAPNHMHMEINRLALETGRHVYSEKPLTLTAEEAFALCELARKTGKRTAVNFSYRNHAMVQEMKERIREGRLGTLSHIQVEYLQDWLLYDTDFDWRVRKELGGASRAVADIGSHCFDTIQYILGEPVTAVYAVLHRQYETRKFFRKKETFLSGDITGDCEEVPVENEDGATILFRLKGGMTGSILVSQVCAGKKNGLKILVSGNKESLEWEQENPDKLWIGRKDEENGILFAGKQYLTAYAAPYAHLPGGHPSGWNDALVNGLRDFYQSVEDPGRERRYADFGEGYSIMKLVEACLESSRQNGWVEIK